MTDNKLEELRKKIETVKESQRGVTKQRSVTTPSQIITDILSELCSGIIVGIVIGKAIDNLICSKPLFFIVCILLAFIATLRSFWKKYLIH